MCDTDSLEAACSPERSVWLIARPQPIGGSALSHWAVLFSPYSRVDLNVTWATRSSISSAVSKPWGTLIEPICTHEHIYRPRIDHHFGQLKVLQEWPSSIIAHIDQIKRKEDYLENCGRLPKDLSPYLMRGS